MAEIAGVDVIASKWARVTPTRTADYESGVKNPARDWSRATLAAADAWKAGITESVAKGTWQKGVTSAGSSTWQSGAVDKGVPRWGPGVQVAEPVYAAGFAPYREAIARVTLPPRYARRDPRNLQRVNAVVDALVKTKQAKGG
jgi:hypothetical protein